jgi:hypothetical protein
MGNPGRPASGVGRVTWFLIADGDPWKAVVGSRYWSSIRSGGKKLVKRTGIEHAFDPLIELVEAGVANTLNDRFR